MANSNLNLNLRMKSGIISTERVLRSSKIELIETKSQQQKKKNRKRSKTIKKAIKRVNKQSEWLSASDSDPDYEPDDDIAEEPRQNNALTKESENELLLRAVAQLEKENDLFRRQSQKQVEMIEILKEIAMKLQTMSNRCTCNFEKASDFRQLTSLSEKRLRIECELSQILEECNKNESIVQTSRDDIFQTSDDFDNICEISDNIEQDCQSKEASTVNKKISNLIRRNDTLLLASKLPFRKKKTPRKKILPNSYRFEKSKFAGDADRPYFCDVAGCGKTYKRKDHLKDHFMRKHMPDKARVFTCTWPGCEYRAPRRSILGFHIKCVHQKEKSFTCEWPGCDVKFGTVSARNLHFRRHTGEGTFVCVWPGCGEKFYKKAAYVRHTKQHKGEKDYKCDVEGCQFATYTKEQLYQHSFQHGRWRPFGCEWPGCEKRFIYQKKLKIHMRTHTGEKPYPCDWPGCSFRCATNGNLTLHRNNMHLKDKS